MSSKTPSPCAADLPDDDEFVHAIGVDGARYFLHTVVEPKTYRLLLGNGLDCFEGSMPRKPDDKDRAVALTAGGSEFVYRLEPLGDSQARFLWKKHVADGAVLKLGDTLLRRVADSDGQRILEAAVRIVQRREEKVARLQEELEKSRTEQARTLEELSRFERLKKDMEEELYAKFSLVLNAKKRRIAELTADSQSDDLSASMPASPPEATSLLNAKKRRIAELTADSQSDDLPASMPASPPEATSSTSQAPSVQGLLDTLLEG